MLTIPLFLFLALLFLLLGAGVGWLLHAHYTGDRLHQAEQQAKQAELALQHHQEHQNDFKTLMQAELERLTGALIEQKGKDLTDYHQERLTHFLTPLKEHLEGFRKRVEEIHTDQTTAQGGLKQELENVRQLNQQLSADAQNLTLALKGESQRRGAWGELILERTLELSGLEKGREFELQLTMKDRLRPDAVIYLPEERFVVIDAKVSLIDYLRSCDEENPEKRHQALTQHLAAMKQHIKSLSQKNYPTLFEGKTPDFTLMFLPIESAFAVAMNHDPSLFEKALEYKIILVSPVSLLATLKTMEHSWRSAKQEKNVLEIARLGGLLHDRFVDFTNTLLLAQQQMSKALTTQEEAIARLCSQKGNLITTAQRLSHLGAKVEKQLPAHLLEERK